MVHVANHFVQGWRYIWLGNGLLVLIAAILRVTIIRLKETPKYLLAKGQDQEVVDTFQYIAQKYNRTCTLTFEHLDNCGIIKSTYGGSRYGVGELAAHIRGLYATKKMGMQTSLIWFSWLLIGLAYPLFYVFLPDFLKTRGADTGEGTPYFQWRNYMITNTVGIFGPVAGGLMANTPWLGRRYTMVIGALCTMAFFFAYNAIKTAPENLAFTCMIYFFVNVYYGTLYAYTPETLPSAHRATGNGIAVACNRVMGLISAFVAAYANTATSAPIYLCAALYIVMVCFFPNSQVNSIEANASAGDCGCHHAFRTVWQEVDVICSSGSWVVCHRDVARFLTRWRMGWK